VIGAPLKTLVPDTLQCRVSLSPQQIDDFCLDLLIVQVCGPADWDAEDSILRLEILDMTAGACDLHAVYESQGNSDSPGEVFSRQRPLSAISQGQSLVTWTTIAQIDTRQLCFSRQGLRRLEFSLTLVSKAGLPLARGSDLFEYDNPSQGYLDLQENSEQIRLQAVQLAGSLMARDSTSLSANQYGLLRGWLLVGIELSDVSTRGKRTFEKTFQRLLKACRTTDFDQILLLGQDMGSNSTVGQRQEIVEFCLHLIRLSESLPTLALATLQGIAVLWQINTSQFSTILENILSVDRLQEIDPMILLGMTKDMSEEEMLRQLNRAYAKWNARVTHTDKAVQQQAEDMLSWIAEARGRTQGR
jgi:hypothetical protein